MLLVIDALDESAVGGKSKFLELISEEFPNLPPWIKILITSRPELPVKEQLLFIKRENVTSRHTKYGEDLLKYHFDNADCEGSFLYAYYTTAITTENISELVPKGIGGFYQKQLKHSFRVDCQSLREACF